MLDPAAKNAEIVDVSSLSYEDLIHRVPVMSEAVEPGIGSTEPRGLNYVSLFSGLESGGQALLKLKMPWNLLICVSLLQNILIEYPSLFKVVIFSINRLNFLLKAGCCAILKLTSDNYY